MKDAATLAAALTELDWLEGYMGHQVFEDGSDGWDHFIPIRRALEALAVPLVLVRQGSGGVFPDGTTNHPAIDFSDAPARSDITQGNDL